MALPPPQLKVEILCDRLRFCQAIVEGKAGGANEKALGNNSGIVSSGETAARLLDHRLLLRLKGDDLGQTLVAERRIWPEAHLVDRERASFAKRIERRARYVARRGIRVNFLRGTVRQHRQSPSGAAFRD